MIRFRLLGPVEAPAKLPGGKPRALLARLLLEPGRVVPVDTLVDDLWREPPASAHKVVQVYVSQLRKALGPDAIETRAPGYLARATADESDLGRFEQLADQARAAGEAARRAALLREALDLWRGPALAEFREEPFAEAAGRRLAELRLYALEERIDADLELGEHARLVPELEALVEEEPLRERPRGQLMVALYRCGRQAEALARYRDGRALLVDELGIEPGPALQELERAILRQESALAEPQGRPRARGSIVCAVPGLAALLVPLATDHELVLVDLVAEASELRERAAGLAAASDGRTAAFVSNAPGADLARLAAEQDAELLVERLLAAAPCDVAVAPRPELSFEPAAPVVVPFGGAREEWAALELAAWIARAHDLALTLLGTEALKDRRDASRLLASASLALQRFAGTSAEPVLVPPGAAGIRPSPSRARRAHDGSAPARARRAPPQRARARADAHEIQLVVGRRLSFSARRRG
ncbi:MAG: AfsR/SARP family transcriptional regulator [Actinobacteria bacterium]|nr:MAG: AfsR/SARP family transcriptional regulator [Actinomycetota bacterium]